MPDGQYTQFPIDYREFSLSQLAETVDELVERLDGLESNEAFAVTLTFTGWNNNAQTVSNANIIADGYTYFVSASPSDLADYSESAIYADDVTTDGSMTFHCEDEPTTDITVNIVRMKVGE